MNHILPEEQLIEYAKPYLKAKGFKKKCLKPGAPSSTLMPPRAL